MPTEKVLSSLIINEVDTVETLDKMYEAGLIKEDELYLVKEPANTDVVDFEPVKDSQNLVTSGGVFKAIEEKATNIPITDSPAEDVVIWIDPNEESDSSFYTKGEVDRLIEGIPVPDVSGQIQTHNESAEAHSDIRDAVSAAQWRADRAYDEAISKANYTHTHSASDIKTGMFEDAVSASRKEYAQRPTDFVLRNTSLEDYEYIPNYEGEIVWVYE